MRETLRLAGQLVLAGFDGHAASSEIKALVRRFGLGGVVLFARNVDAPEQVAELVRELQECARDSGHDLPLLVAVDQEGGRVQRLREPWTVWPPARALGRARSEDLARRMGEALAAELRACGVNFDLAPVLDVDTNPRNPVIGDRALGDDPEPVGRLGAAFIKGLQAGRVAACGKHFPGHGDTGVDSHLELPLVDHSRARLEDVELRPFRKALEAGVDAIMVGHLLVRELDDAWPASLSERLVSGLLRAELGFDGLVLTDDIEMKALAARFRPGTIARRAVLAGCDLVAVCRAHDAQVEAIEALVRAVESEELAFKRLEQAAGRVRALKERYALPYAPPDPRRARLAAGTSQAQDLARRIESEAGLAV